MQSKGTWSFLTAMLWNTSLMMLLCVTTHPTETHGWEGRALCAGFSHHATRGAIEEASCQEHCYVGSSFTDCNQLIPYYNLTTMWAVYWYQSFRLNFKNTHLNWIYDQFDILITGFIMNLMVSWYLRLLHLSANVVNVKWLLWWVTRFFFFFFFG